MPRNFDELLTEDLSFVVGGETFTMQYVRPEVLAEWEDETLPDEMTAAARIERLDRRIESFLTPDDRDRWRTLRANTDRAVPFGQLQEIVTWMVEMQTARPTLTPSASAGGRGSSGASSSARSRSQEAVPA